MISFAGLGLIMAALAAAQTPGPLSFEVASVKESAPASREGKMKGVMSIRGTTVEIDNAPLVELVRIAYRVKPYQVTGPEKATSEHFDVLAKLPDGASPEQAPEMLQQLLTERFRLSLRRDTREHAIYALVAAKGGLKLQEAGNASNAPTKNGENRGGSVLLNRDMTLSSFADFLSRFADRPVVDLTGRTETYQIAIEMAAADLKGVKRAAEAGADPDPASSPIFMSLPKLGLKIEPRKAPMDVLTIEHFEKLAEN